MKGILLPLLQQLLILLVTVGIGFLINLLQKKLGIEKMKKIQVEIESKKQLVSIAIKFIQQTYEDLNGQEKYELAVKWIADAFNEKGLSVSQSEIQGLLESTLKELKMQFKDAWKEKINTQKEDENNEL